MHMLKEFIIEALRTTCPISHVLNLNLIMLARSYVFFILLISSLLDPNVQLVTLTLTPDVKH